MLNIVSHGTDSPTLTLNGSPISGLVSYKICQAPGHPPMVSMTFTDDVDFATDEVAGDE